MNCYDLSEPHINTFKKGLSRKASRVVTHRWNFYYTYVKKMYDRMPELQAYSEAERKQIWKECSQRALRQPPVLIGIVAGAVAFVLIRQFIIGGAIGGALGGAIIAVILAPLIISATKKEVRKKLAAGQP